METNGAIEQVYITLKKNLIKLVVNWPSKWSNFVVSAVFAFNISYHSTTKFTPLQMIYGRHPALPPLLYNLIKNSGKIRSETYMKKLVKVFINIQTQAYSIILKQRLKNKETDD